MQAVRPRGIDQVSLHGTAANGLDIFHAIYRRRLKQFDAGREYTPVPAGSIIITAARLAPLQQGKNTMTAQFVNDLNRDLDKYNILYTALHAQLYARLDAGEPMSSPQVSELSRRVDNAGWVLNDITLALNNLEGF